MKIEVLGTGCPKCKKTYENAEKAIKELGIEAELVKVYDSIEIAKRGVLETPALAIDGEIKVAGRVPSKEEIKEMLKNE
ncbi:MAG TPA: thioredoxin family protein [Thermoplasmatales archaeon]|nr:TM0996/MTH895 family glutaredoxin-like protein [Thermoplasmata archaeon]HHF55676.1 thioredoxin family protein [Thermoplasmatales archaeon]